MSKICETMHGGTLLDMAIATASAPPDLKPVSRAKLLAWLDNFQATAHQYAHRMKTTEYLPGVEYLASCAEELALTIRADREKVKTSRLKHGGASQRANTRTRMIA